MTRLPALALLGFVGTAGPAWAQPVAFEDDFESGTLLTSEMPPGKWDALSAPVAANVVQASAVAAHSGQYGLWVVDGSGGFGTGNENHLVGTLANVGASDLRVARFGLRFAGAGSGTLTVLELDEPNGGVVIGTGFGTASVRLSVPDGALTLRTTSDAAASQTSSLGPSLTQNQWHEVELLLSGVDTANGAAELRLDGALAGALTGINWSGFPASRLALGLPSATRSWVGEVAVDDLRILLGRPDGGGAVGADGGGPADGGDDGGLGPGPGDGGDSGPGGEGDAGTPPGDGEPLGLQVGCGCGQSGLLVAALLVLAPALARHRGRRRSPREPVTR